MKIIIELIKLNDEVWTVDYNGISVGKTLFSGTGDECIVFFKLLEPVLCNLTKEKLVDVEVTNQATK